MIHKIGMFEKKEFLRVSKNLSKQFTLSEMIHVFSDILSSLHLSDGQAGPQQPARSPKLWNVHFEMKT